MLEGEHVKYVNNKIAEKKYFKNDKLIKHEFIDDNSNVIKAYRVVNTN